MAEHETRHEIIYTPEQYWNDPRVVSSVLEFMGGEGSSWQDTNTVSHEFVGLATEQKAFSHKRSPVSTFHPSEIDQRLRSVMGRGELSVSYLQQKKEDIEQPKRVLMCWDIDRFKFRADNNYDEPYLIHNPEAAFYPLAGVYDLYKEFFHSHGIPFLSVMSGKGYHFFTQVEDPGVIGDIQHVGNTVEDSVQYRLQRSHTWSKAPGPIPVFHEQAFKGGGRIQQYVNTLLIQDARKRTPLKVEIWDKGFPGEGTDGIALDNTPALFTVNTKMIGALGSPYFIKAALNRSPQDKMILQLPVEGQGFQHDWKEVLQKRYNFTQSAEVLAESNNRVPDSSAGVRGLIDGYYQSGLFKLHQAMDASEGDDPSTYDYGYRRDHYEGVIRQSRDPHTVRNTVQFANPMLVQNRHAVDHLVFQVFHAMGGNQQDLAPAPHVAGFLRSIYEDRRYNWGDTWNRHVDANRWARGSVEQVLGQIFQGLS